VTLLDSGGNPVSGSTVALDQGSGSSTIGTASGPSDLNGQVTFTVSDAFAEAVTYTAFDLTDSVIVTPTATVTFQGGPVHQGTSQVSASPPSQIDDGATTSLVTVTLYDAVGNPVSGKTVTLAQGSGSSLISSASGPSDLNGQVTFTVTDTFAETVTYTATDVTDSVILTNTAAVTFQGGPVDAGNSGASASPISQIDNGATTSLVTVTLLDSGGNPVSGSTVALDQGSGSSTIGTASGPSDLNGQVTFTVSDAFAEAVTYTATDVTDSVIVTPTATVTFQGGTPDAGVSMVSGGPTSQIDDGLTTSLVTVTLLDSGGNPVSGKTVTLDQGGGSSTIGAASGPSDLNGQVTFLVRDAKAEAVTYTAADTTDSVTVTQTKTVTFQGGTVTAAQSTVSGSPASVVNDGVTTSTVTVTLKDALGNVVSGKTVTLAQGAGSSTISAASGTSDLNGQVTFTVKDTTVETVTYTAHDVTDDGLLIIQTGSVMFVMPPPPASGPSSAAPPAGIPAGDLGPPQSTTASSTTTSSVTVASSTTSSSTISIPAGALPAGTTVSAYPITNTAPLVADVPPGQSYVVALAITWQAPDGTSPAALLPITLTITDPAIKAGDVIYEVNAAGVLTNVGTATADGSVTITFFNDPTFLVTAPQLVAQSALSITSLSGTVGTALTLVTSGGSGTGAISFSVTNGTASGCALSGDSLSATSAGTCVVTAAKAADATHLGVSSGASNVSFVKAVQANPASAFRPVIGTFGFQASALTNATKNALINLSRKLKRGASVTITGYALKDVPLAHARATAAQVYLVHLVRVHVTIKVVTNQPIRKVKVVVTAV
jgi:hypothetical protein